MKALVLEKKLQLSLRDIELPTEVNPNDVKIKMHTVGICGSDVHYYTHGKIGPFVVKNPMVLGHEGSGTIIEVGSNVSNLKVGDRVCVEPGVPDINSKEYMKGIYNLDPKLTFWATPPDHGCLTPEVVFPSNFVFKLPDNVSYAEGAMIEPLAVGLQAAEKAKIIPGETALVMGCGPIGLVIALTALAGGCSKVFIADIVSERIIVKIGNPGDTRFLSDEPINLRIDVFEVQKWNGCQGFRGIFRFLIFNQALSVLNQLIHLSVR